MKKIILPIITFMITFFCAFININTIYAQNISEINDTLAALKEATKIDNKTGEYEINIKLPGYENEKISGYNIIIVMDGSYSTDNTWQKMRASVISMVNNVLPENDPEMNFNKVALISFGVDYHINIPLTNDKKVFENIFPTERGGYLLRPGRSATNTEVGLKGAREYIESLSKTALAKDKEHTYVIYLTDGGVNLTEAPFNYYNYLINNSRNYQISRSILVETLVKLDESDETVTYDEILSSMINELKEKYQDKENNIITVRNIFDKYGTNSETITNFLNEKIKDFFVSSGYNIEKEYPAGEFERMFVNKQYITGNNSLRADLLDIIYLALDACKERGNNGISRTIAEGNRLKEYATIYTIGYNANSENAKNILDPTYGNNTKENHYSSSYSYANENNINEKLNSLIKDITKINYKNIKIIDYTSKWVTPLDSNNDGIFDEKDITVTNNGILTNNITVKVEKLTKEEIELLNDPELINNTNNDIYRITWTINNYLRSWDNYKLTYKVKVDTMEKDFISEKQYPANGNIDLTYTIIEIDNNNEETIIKEKAQGEIIRNDLVSQKENIIIITKTDKQGNLLPSADFDITSTNGTNQINKEYSIDGINYTKDNKENNATHFRFTGLYDYEYTISETKVPENYNTAKDITFDFNNKEGIIKNITIINNKDSKVIIHYVVKINNEYIPLTKIAYDSNGNLLPNFKNVNIKDITLVGEIGEKFQTKYDEIELLSLEGLYSGNLLTNKDSSKLTYNIIEDQFTENTKEYTYVYSLNIGTGNILPPQTGYELPLNHLSILLISLFTILITKKIYIKK